MPTPRIPSTSGQFTSVRARNFKSFRRLRVNLKDFNLVIGPNASGKSNFLSIFRLIRDIGRLGVDDALSLQGGFAYVRDLRAVPNQPIAVGISYHSKGALNGLPMLAFSGPPDTEFRDIRIDYDLEIMPPEKAGRFGTESLRIAFKYAREGENKEHSGAILCSQSILKPPSVQVRLNDSNDIKQNTLLNVGLLLQRGGTSLFLQSEMLGVIVPQVKLLSDLFYYDVDPKFGKAAIPITGRKELDENGDNLATALKAILSDRDHRREFLNLITELLPFITQVEVSSFSDLTRLLRVREGYTADAPVPAFLLSHGTIEIIALIIALYFQDAALTIVEEPDRSLHPLLIRKLAALIAERSSERQLIVSTHSSDFMESVPIESVLCVQRMRDGHSTVFPASSESRFQPFLDTMGIGRASAMNILRAG